MGEKLAEGDEELANSNGARLRRAGKFAVPTLRRHGFQNLPGAADISIKIVN
jgi:hypothetical protein